MAKISRNIVILICVMSCVLFSAGHLVGPTAEAQAKKAEQVEDPYKDSTVLVEAFVVEVKVSALYDLGVSPIGQKPNSVSIENILKCLRDKDSARVTTGAKVAVQQKWSGNTDAETTETISEEQHRPAKTSKEGSAVVSRSHQSLNISKSFEASANILPDSRIQVGFDFSHVVGEKIDSKNDTQINTTVQRQWSGHVCLEAGKAIIAGATQDRQKAAFLVLCADIKSE